VARPAQTGATFGESRPPFHPGELVRYRPANHVERVERILAVGSDNGVTWHVLTSWHRDHSRWAPAAKFERV
jgi:hypothetical protein